MAPSMAPSCQVSQVPVRDVAELERLLQAERLERIESVQNLQRDFDSQQKVLTQLSEQVLSLQRVFPLGQGAPSSDGMGLVANRVAALEEMGGHPKLVKLEEAVAQLQGRIEVQEKQQDLQASALCEGIADMHFLSAKLTADKKPASQKDVDGTISTMASMASMLTVTQAASEASSNIEELLEVTSELARVLEVERQARNIALTEMDKRLTQSVDECLHVKDTQALFEAWEKSGVDKYGRVSSELAEMWDILEARMSESSDRLDRVELHLFRETMTPRRSSVASISMSGTFMNGLSTPPPCESLSSRISLASVSASWLSAQRCGSHDSADADSEKAPDGLSEEDGLQDTASDTPVVDTLQYCPSFSELDVSCTIEVPRLEQIAEHRASSMEQSQESSTTAESGESDQDLPPVERLRVAYRRLRDECEAACRHAVEVSASPRPVSASPRPAGRSTANQPGQARRA